MADGEDALVHIRGLREQIEQTKIDIERAERATDLAKAAELRYGRLVQLEHDLNEAEAHLAEIN